jgi:hypothetical protein
VPEEGREREVDVDGFGRSSSRGGDECRHVPLTSLAFL